METHLELTLPDRRKQGYAEFEKPDGFPVLYFHGEQDLNVPVEIAQRITQKISGAKLIPFPKGGHISAYTNHFDEIAKRCCQAIRKLSGKRINKR